MRIDDWQLRELQLLVEPQFSAKTIEISCLESSWSTITSPCCLLLLCGIDQPDLLGESVGLAFNRGTAYVTMISKL